MDKWKRIFRKYNGRCDICGLELHLNKCKYTDSNYCHFDHIIPKSFGGSGKEANLRAICKSCNSSRGNRYGKLLINATKKKIDDSDLRNGKRDLLILSDYKQGLLNEKDLLNFKRYIKEQYDSNIRILDSILLQGRVDK